MSIFKISEFKKYLRPVRPNLFDAKLVLNARVSEELGQIQSNGTETFSFRCETAEFPGKTLDVVEDPGGGGPSLRLGQNMSYADITITIICSEDMRERALFENWMQYIVGIPGSGGNFTGGIVQYHENYALDNLLVVSQYNPQGTKLFSYTMTDVFPTSLSPMTASWEETNTYQRFQVTMAYRYHTFENSVSS
jgi:hypothetical protein